MTTALSEECGDRFHLRWTDLSADYTTKTSFFAKSSSFTALHPCSGHVASGSITAVLGPSGAGKSTLFNCITGRVAGAQVSGQCFLSGPHHLLEKLASNRIAYVPQVAEFFTLFTVRETLLFASRLNNVGWTRKQHEAEMRSLMVAFDMEDKLDWQIRKLSGGQQKRLAIACELVSSPAAIVLDEPTSGLDADNAEKLIRHLKSLVTCEKSTMKPAVLLSIHTPSLETFYSFEQVYILATGGYNLFQGPPHTAEDFFRSHGFGNLRGNPAEWCVEVATGKYGSEKFSSLAFQSRTLQLESGSYHVSTDSMNKPQCSSLMQIWLLATRSLNYYFTKLPQAVVITICHVSNLNLFDIIMLPEPLAQDPQCWQKAIDSEQSAEETSLATMKISVDFQQQFDAARLVAHFLMMFNLAIAFVGPVTALLIIWYHEAIYERELRNTWYTRNCNYVAKLLSESISRLFCMTGCGIAIYFISYSSIEPWRLVILASAMYMLCTVWENFASAFTLTCGRRAGLISIACYLSLLEFIDIILVDSIVFEEDARYLAMLAKQVSPMNRAYSIAMIALFGFNRCQSSQDGVLSSLSMGKNDGPREVLSRTWHSLNITRDDFVDTLDIYEADESTVSGLFTSLSAWMLPAKSVQHEQPSYILSFFSYDESHLTYHFTVLAAWVVVSCLLLFYTMKRTSV